MQGESLLRNSSGIYKLSKKTDILNSNNDPEPVKIKFYKTEPKSLPKFSVSEFGFYIKILPSEILAYMCQ